MTYTKARAGVNCIIIMFITIILCGWFRKEWKADATRLDNPKIIDKFISASRTFEQTFDSFFVMTHALQTQIHALSYFRFLLALTHTLSDFFDSSTHTHRQADNTHIDTSAHHTLLWVVHKTDGTFTHFTHGE